MEGLGGQEEGYRLKRSGSENVDKESSSGLRFHTRTTSLFGSCQATPVCGNQLLMTLQTIRALYPLKKWTEDARVQKGNPLLKIVHKCGNGHFH